jgi:glycerol-3-phosphate O-acyltransferase
MSTRDPTPTGPLNRVLGILGTRFFQHIQVDDAWLRETRELSRRGSVVYVLGSPNIADFLALDYLTRRHGLPPIRFVNDAYLSLLHPGTRQSLVDLLLPQSKAAELRQAIEQGGSPVLFLRSPSGELDAGRRGDRGGLEEGEELIFTLFELQRQRSQPILLVPQVFVWTKRPEPQGAHPAELLFELREWPSALLAVGQFLANYRHAALKVGEAVDLGEILARPEGSSDPELGRQVAYTLLRRLERERRAVTGPAEKSPDRVRREILRSPRLRAAIEDLAGERAEDRAVLRGQAMAMLRELQAVPDVNARSALELLCRRVFERAYAGFEVEPADIERIRRASREGTLLLLPSHKSHFDYLFLSYIFNDLNLPMPLIAAGENLNFFPAGALLRRGGAFFIRRSFKGDRLYAAVVDTYIRRLIRDGHAIELYLEGTRSRTGKLLAPKFGLLSMILDAALAVSQQTAYIVPISIGYEHLVDARAHQRELVGGEKRKENAVGLLQLPRLLRHRHGRINLQLGQILTLREIREELGLPPSGQLPPAKRRALVTRLGNRVMDEINRVTAVTPGSLTALVLLNDQPQRAASHRSLYRLARCLLDVLAGMGARITPSALRGGSALHPAAFREAVQMFLDAELVVPAGRPPARRSIWSRRPRVSEEAAYLVPDSSRLALDTSKNMVVHFFVERALVAIAVLMGDEHPVPAATVRDRVHKLSHLLKHEFRFRTDATFDEIFERTVAGMLSSQTLTEVEGKLEPGVGVGRDGTGGLTLFTYANILKNFLEGYRVAARAAASLARGPVNEKELVKRALALGPRMLASGEIERREAISKPIFENALSALVDEQYLRRDGDRLELAESLRTPKAASALEGRIAAFGWSTPR